MLYGCNLSQNVNISMLNDSCEYSTLSLTKLQLAVRRLCVDANFLTLLDVRDALPSPPYLSGQACSSSEYRACVFLY